MDSIVFAALRRKRWRYYRTSPMCFMIPLHASPCTFVSLDRQRREESFLIVYRELSSLVRDLGIPAKTLYGVSNTVETHYHKVQLPKQDGGVRELSVPDPILKHIQRRITQLLLLPMPISRYASAYRYGASTLRNAAPHAGQSGILKLDIRHFFDSILYSTVKDKAFPPEIYAEPLRILLTMLCYRRDALPQGAPSSPAITNIIMAQFDEEVGAWCRSRSIRYTRYCDDMTFSGDFDPREVKAFVSQKLREMGFFLNESKSKYLPAGQRQTVTGLVVNEKPAVPSDYLRSLRQELYFCQKFGVSDHMAHLGIKESEAHYLARLLGRVNYVLQITPGKKEWAQARAWLLEQWAK